jgi:hypothetical protein
MHGAHEAWHEARLAQEQTTSVPEGWGVGQTSRGKSASNEVDLCRSWMTKRTDQVTDVIDAAL